MHVYLKYGFKEIPEISSKTDTTTGLYIVDNKI